MINLVVKAITEELNEFIKIRYLIPEPKVIISNLINEDGSVPVGSDNKIICSLINIEQDRILSEGEFMTSEGSKKSLPVNIDLYLMFSANYTAENYIEGLRFLSVVMNFFHDKMVFTQGNTVGLPADVQKVTFNKFNIDLGNMSHLWAALGAKYKPSVIYKVQMVTIFQDRLLAEMS